MNLSKKNLYLLLGIILAWILLSILWKIPQSQSSAYREKFTPEVIEKLSSQERIQLEKNAADIENNTRLTLAQIIGGLALLSGLYFTYQNVKAAQDNAKTGQENIKLTQENIKLTQENLRITEEGKLTERFSKAVEMLGSEKLEVRLGGIYALERIARDSQKDHWTVMEVLTGFVRENAPNLPDEKNESKQMETTLREDIQAIMTVIGRRKWSETETQPLNLQKVNLAGCILTGANLSKADLSKADLSKADLSKADLNQSDLSKVDLNKAKLSESDLSKADLIEGNLSEADLFRANLSRGRIIKANLSEAILDEANLNRANLSKANLCKADLIEVNLSEAVLRGTDLSEADLCGANLSDANLSGANLNRVNLNGAVLSKARFNNANLSNANLSDVNLSNANFKFARLVTLWQILSAKNFNEAILSIELKKELKEWQAKQAKDKQVANEDSPDNQKE